MAMSGGLIYRPAETAWAADPSQPRGESAIYSLRDCDENYCDYMQGLIDNNGKTVRRPRSEEYLYRHDEMLEKLAAVDPILYDDAISTAQASAILGVHVTWVNHLIREGKVRARPAINERKSGGRVYLVSRRSCEEHRAEVLALERVGRKPGRPRLPPSATPLSARKPQRR